MSQNASRNASGDRNLDDPESPMKTIKVERQQRGVGGKRPSTPPPPPCNTTRDTMAAIHRGGGGEG